MENLFKKIQSNSYQPDTHKRYYSLYRNAPLIIAIVIFSHFFIWGIVDPCVFNGGGYYSSYYHVDKWYGIMQLPNGFLCWFFWTLIGTFISVLSFFAMRIALSYKILQTLYLQQIAEQQILQIRYLQQIAEPLSKEKE